MNILLGLLSFVVNNAEILIGIVMIFLIDYLNKDVKSERGRFFIAGFACVVASLFINFNEILYGSPEQVLTSATLIFAESQAVFKLYFKDSWARWKAMSLYSDVDKKAVESTTGASTNSASEVIPVTE